MNVLHVVGSRSAFLRLSPVVAALRRSVQDQMIVFAGDWTDLAPQDRFLKQLDLPEPEFMLGSSAGSASLRTGRALIALEPIVSRLRPDWIFAVGDVDAALASALVARKGGVPVAHLEAGLRTGDDSSSAEVNRVLTDRLSDLLFTVQSDAAEVLAQEGIPPDRIHHVGNVVADALELLSHQAARLDLRSTMNLEDGSFLLAILRSERDANDEELAEILTALDASAIETGCPALVVLEPALTTAVRRRGLEPLLAPLSVLEPVGYAELVALMEGAAAVIADERDVSDLATLLGIPWVYVGAGPLHSAALHTGSGKTAGYEVEEVVAAVLLALETTPVAHRPELWDGHAAERIASIATARLASCAA